MNWKNLGLWVLTTMLVAACGGGGSNSPAYKVSNSAAFGNGTSGGSSGGTTGSTDVSSNVSGTVVLSLSSNTISASQPATVTAVVKDAAGNPISGALVQFALTGTSASTLATLSPASTITDANGQAATTLTPSRWCNQRCGLCERDRRHKRGFIDCQEGVFCQRDERDLEFSGFVTLVHQRLQHGIDQHHGSWCQQYVACDGQCVVHLCVRGEGQYFALVVDDDRPQWLGDLPRQRVRQQQRDGPYQRADCRYNGAALRGFDRGCAIDSGHSVCVR